MDAVIFDLDGTLADTLDDIAEAMNAALGKLGLPGHPHHAYREMVGEGVARLAQNALPPDRQALVPDAVAAFRAFYAAHAVDRTRPFPEVPALLDALCARGVRMAVLSNKFDELTTRIVRQCFGRWPLSPVYGERAGVPKKPDPTSALEIARAFDVPPARVAFVGDTAVDMETAARAGMFGVGVLWGFRGRAELERSGAKAIITRPEELLPLVRGAAGGPS